MRKRDDVLHQKWLRSVLILIVAGILTVCLLVQLDRKLRPCVMAVCEAETRSYASDLIGSSIQRVLAEQNYTYSDFATLLYDETGSVIAVETMTQNINQLQAALLQSVNQDLKASQSHTISVSLGTATGIWLFAGKGPSIRLRLLPIGDASVKLISSLESAGINQTCHTVKAEVTATIATAIPFHQTQVEISYSYLLTETVIVGTVPDAYVEFGE